MSDTYINQDYINCGFFDAIEISPGVYDRIYSADEMSKPYTRLISDGIFAAQQGTLNADFKVTAASTPNMTVEIARGEGIFWSKWFELTQAQTVTIEGNTSEYTRIDSIIIQVNTSMRLGRVAYRPGEPAETPVPPDLQDTANIKEWRIANITVASYATEITNADISDRRGLDTPFVASLVQTLSTEQLFTQWNDLFNSYFTQVKADVDNWLNDLTEELRVTMNLSELTYTKTFESDGTTMTISNYDSVNDVIFVEVNGISLRPTEYTVSADGTTITFGSTLVTGTTSHVRILKSVKAPIAEGRSF